MDTRTFFVYFGIPTLFIMLCMTVVGWVSSTQNMKFVQKLSRWVIAWSLFGCSVAILLAVTAGIMNTDFVYNHASLVWPFCLSLAAFNDGPHSGAELLVVGIMGIINGLYYALLAGLTWKIFQALPKKSRVE
jgi:hypothetical protein